MKIEIYDKNKVVARVTWDNTNIYDKFFSFGLFYTIVK